MELILPTIAAAVILGTLGQLCASLWRMPAIVFLLALGMLAGPHGVGIVHPQSLGQGLPTLTAAFIAVILFEGGLSLSPQVMRHAITPVRRLITLGALLTMIGATLAAKASGLLSWTGAVVFGSLVIVTGPTVVTPILRRVRLESRLNAVLKSEGILIDAVGAVTAVVVLEYVLSLEQSWAWAPWGFVQRLGIGAIVGVGFALAAAGLWRLRIFQERENEHLVELGSLGVALGAFALAEWFCSESGVMAATAAGVVLAAIPIPFREDIEKFKENLTILGVSVLFILLSANIDPRALWQVGWQELALMAALIFVVRPASVWLSTWGTDLSWNEKAYVSLLAPRGIVAATMASHFAHELKERAIPGAERIESLVFLTIAVTVCLQGGWAGRLAKLLRVTAGHPSGILIVGVSTWSLAVARLVQERGLLVRFLDVNPVQCETAREQGFEAVQADASDEHTFEGLDLSDVGTLIAMTSNDAVNTLACDAANDWLGHEHVFQILSKPVDGEPRAKVRLSGRWAMPGMRSHHTLCALLRRDELEPAQIACDEPRDIERQMQLGDVELLVPVLIVSEQGVRIAADGDVCRAGERLIGFAPNERSSRKFRPSGA